MNSTSGDVTTETTIGGSAGSGITAQDLRALEREKWLRGQCAEAKKDFQKALNEFEKGCTGAKAFLDKFDSSGAVAKEKTTGLPACYHQIAKCRECGSNPDAIGCIDLSKFGIESSNLAEDDSAYETYTSARADAEAALENMKRCDMLDSDSLKEAREKMREIKKDKRDRAEQISKRKSQMQEEQFKATKAVQDIEASQENQGIRIQEKINDIKKRMAELDTAIAEQTEAIGAQVVNLNSDIDNMRTSMGNADIDLLDVENKLRMGCHAHALAQAEKFQADLEGKISRSELSPGDMSALFKGTGQSLKQKIKAKATEIYSDCLSDKPFRMSFDSAARKRDANKMALRNQINKAEKNRQVMMDRMNRLKTTERSKKLEDLVGELKAQTDAYNKFMDQKGKEKSQKMMENMQAANSHRERIALWEQENQDDDMEAKTARKLLEAKRKIGGGDKLSESLDKAVIGYRDVSVAASGVVGSCCRLEEEKNSPVCQGACRYKSSDGDSVSGSAFDNSSVCPPRAASSEQGTALTPAAGAVREK